MEKLKTILERTLNKSGTDEIVNNGRAINLWSKAAGKEISMATEATHLEKGIMFVKTESPAWRNELLFRKKEIIKKLNDHLKKTIVRDIRFI
jgi:predicted nucleic acid-binding Zn ribbon protein|tara:strand:+ start:584 stop:859 length:276 start_codon:yes stop_codon:yes gene_type:complete